MMKYAREELLDVFDVLDAMCNERALDWGDLETAVMAIRRIADSLPDELTNREKFAAMVLQGIVTGRAIDSRHDSGRRDLAAAAITHADALIAALEAKQ